jgi:hypothetical protein
MMEQRKAELGAGARSWQRNSQHRPHWGVGCSNGCATAATAKRQVAIARATGVGQPLQPHAQQMDRCYRTMRVLELADPARSSCWIRCCDWKGSSMPLSHCARRRRAQGTLLRVRQRPALRIQSHWERCCAHRCLSLLGFAAWRLAAVGWLLGLLLWPNRKQDRSHALREGKACPVCLLRCCVLLLRVVSPRFAVCALAPWRAAAAGLPTGRCASALWEVRLRNSGTRKHTKIDTKRLDIPLSTHVRGVVLWLRAIRANLAIPQCADRGAATHNSTPLAGLFVTNNEHGCCAVSSASCCQGQQKCPGQPSQVSAGGIGAARGEGSWFHSVFKWGELCVLHQLPCVVDANGDWTPVPLLSFLLSVPGLERTL